MENEYFETIKLRFIGAAMQTNDCAKDKDVNRNHVNYGCCTSWGQVLRDMGHVTDIPVWEDESGCLRIPYLKVNDEKIIEFN